MDFWCCMNPSGSDASAAGCASAVECLSLPGEPPPPDGTGGIPNAGAGGT
jgi:hypothetical protein